MPVIPISDLHLAGKKVLVRCDFNVPLEAGKITDPARMARLKSRLLDLLAQR